MKKILVALVLFVSAAGIAEAQVKNRWKLEWSNERPQAYTYRSPDEKYSSYWFFTYTLENRTDEIVPIIVDILLYTEAGKDLMHDVRKVDASVVKEGLETPRKSESLKLGRFYANIIDPEAEYKIIEYHAKLGNRSDGIVRESIENFKKGFTEDPPEEFKGKWKKEDRLYLNPREMRGHRWIQPGQKLMGIAIFKNVDARARSYEIQVSGLTDIVKIIGVTEEEWKLEYEPSTSVVRYERFGDEFENQRDVLYKFVHRRDVIKKIGPVASKETIDRLVNALADTLKKEREWREQNVAPDEIKKRREKDAVEPLDTNIMAMTFKQATGKDFGYDTAKDVLENEKAVWRIHEWWINNRAKLAFNEATLRFEIKEDVLPGTVIEK